MKFKFLWILILLGIAAVWTAEEVFADSPLLWDVPYVGTFNLNLNATEAILGYDAVLHQAIGGASLPVYTDPKGIVALQIGAVAPWPTNNATIEPYIGAGHDFAKEIPGLNQYNSIHLNVFARYATDQGKAGAGVSFSYSFAGGTVTAMNPAVPPPVPASAK